jgi:hypothetical protein
MKVNTVLSVVGILIGILTVSLVAKTADRNLEIKTPQVHTTEVYEVVEHIQEVRSPHGNIRVAILRNGKGELRAINLTQPLEARLPLEAKYAYVTGRDDYNVESITPIFPVMNP